MISKEKPLVTLAAVGDVNPNRDDPPSLFRFCGDVFRTADVVFGQLEHPLTDKGCPTSKNATRLPPKNIRAVSKEGAGFDVMSCAGNHAMDYSWDGFLDTLDNLGRSGILVVGAGRTIAEARKPAIVEREGTRVGFLGYLSITHSSNMIIADETLPGCAPLRASHLCQQEDEQPGAPPFILTKLYPEDKATMEEDIRALRPHVDVLVVSMHCGVHHVPALIAMYQKEAAHAAVDAGADLVLQHHAHILKGIEVYKSKAVFYGLGNFAFDPNPTASGRPAQGGRKYHYDVRVEAGYENYPFHHDAQKTMIAKAYIQDRKIQKVSYVPAYIRPTLEPEVVTRENPRAQEIFDYVAKISETEGLKTTFSWAGNEVVVGDGKP